MIERDEEREHEKSDERDERKLVLMFKFRGSIHTHTSHKTTSTYCNDFCLLL